MPTDRVIEVGDAPDRGAYLVTVDGEEVGRAEYRMKDGIHVFTHTEVDKSRRGEGLGSRLVRGALEDVRRRGGSLVALCPFVSAYLKRQPEFEDLIDHELTDFYRRPPRA